MTGKSLGLRTVSYGFLQSQVQSNGMLQNIARKNSKMALSSHREKERLLVYVSRSVCRRRIGLVILVGLALLAFTSNIFYVNKGPPGLLSRRQVIEPLEPLSSKQDSQRGYRIRNAVVQRSEHKYWPLRKSNGQLFVDHPCNHYAFPPPPPVNRKRVGPRPCAVCYLPVDQAIASMPNPSVSPVLHNLNYVHEENPTKKSHGGSDFGGYPSLKQRNDSFDIKESMTVHCGFVKGSRPGRGSGFDIEEADLLELDRFHEVIVVSAIFGNYDSVRQPSNISEAAKKHVPFYMFIDEDTEEYLKNNGKLDGSKRIGLWRIIVVRNLPYSDPRRNGKVPKLLLHRLLPNVRYSIWMDGKLRLVEDPYRILERFLWRQNATFAISRHYKRFDVFVEAEANKAGQKYSSASIDYQIDFYKKEGLTPYSEPKLPITSDVPEGCVIIREHLPVTNLFTCLWFNEVDRFTSRDQLSFSTVRDKIMSKINWSVSMFRDCERRNFVIQEYHKPLADIMPPPPPAAAVVINRQEPVQTAGRAANGKRNPTRHGRDRRSGSRRHRKFVAGGRDTSFF